MTTPSYPPQLLAFPVAYPIIAKLSWEEVGLLCCTSSEVSQKIVEIAHFLYKEQFVRLINANIRLSSFQPHCRNFKDLKEQLLTSVIELAEQASSDDQFSIIEQLSLKTSYTQIRQFYHNPNGATLPTVQAAATCYLRANQIEKMLAVLQKVTWQKMYKLQSVFDVCTSREQADKVGVSILGTPRVFGGLRDENILRLARAYLDKYQDPDVASSILKRYRFEISPKYFDFISELEADIARISSQK